MIGRVKAHSQDGQYIDIGTARDAFIPKQYITKQALVEGNYLYCKVRYAQQGAQTILEYNDATCAQLPVSSGALVFLNSSECVYLSLHQDIQLEIAKRIKF